jgi:hypothetical protein
MPIDYIEGKFVDEPAKVREDLIPKILLEVEPGTVCFVDQGNVAIDGNGEWQIYTSATIRQVSEEVGYDGVIRVIVTDKGYIVDSSHLDMSTEEVGFDRTETWFFGPAPEGCIEPVKEHIRDADALNLVMPIMFAEFGITLEPLEVE